MRRWRPGRPNPYDPPPGDYRDYVGFQKIINCKDGQVDPDKLQEHLDMIMADTRYKWETISPVSFESLKPGDRIRYTTMNQKNEHLFRTGGWVTALSPDLDWLSYMAHTQTSWCLQLADCVNLWVIRKVKKAKAPKAPKVPITRFKVPVDPSLKFKVTLTNSRGEEVIVFSSDTKARATAFRKSKKYQKALHGCAWEFHGGGDSGELYQDSDQELDGELDQDPDQDPDQDLVLVPVPALVKRQVPAKRPAIIVEKVPAPDYDSDDSL